jgi:hypothetical protein
MQGEQEDKKAGNMENGAIPAEIKNVYLTLGNGVKLEPGILGKKLRELSINLDNGANLPPGVVPEEVEELSIRVGTQANLEPGAVRGKFEKLKMELYNKESLPLNAIDGKIKFMQIDQRNAASLRSGAICANIKKMSFAIRWCKAKLSPGIIPLELEDLEIDFCPGDGNIEEGAIPAKVKKLKMDLSKKIILKRGAIHNGIKDLHIKSYPEICLEDDAIPQGIKNSLLEIDVGHKWNSGKCLIPKNFNGEAYFNLNYPAKLFQGNIPKGFKGILTIQANKKIFDTHMYVVPKGMEYTFTNWHHNNRFHGTKMIGKGPKLT